MKGNNIRHMKVGGKRQRELQPPLAVGKEEDELVGWGCR